MSKISNFHKQRQLGNRPLSLSLFSEKLKAAHILDLRPARAFQSGFIPGSVSLPIDSNLELYLEKLKKKLNPPFLLIAEPGDENRALDILTRFGLNGVLGYLDGGFTAWQHAHRKFEMIPTLGVEDLEMVKDEGDFHLLESTSGRPLPLHLPGAKHFSIDQYLSQVYELRLEDKFIIYSERGQLSSVLGSLLLRKGYKHVFCLKESLEDLIKSHSTFLSVSA